MALGISPMPSSLKSRRAMLKLLEETHATNPGINTGPIFELGSGWGNLLIPLAKQYPQQKIVGYELSFIPWLITWILIKVLGLNNAKVIRKNFIKENLTQASVIFCYLYPEAMEEIDKKIKEEANRIEDENTHLKYLISNNFSLPHHDPIKTIELDDLYRSPVHLYELKGVR